MEKSRKAHISEGHLNEDKNVPMILFNLILDQRQESEYSLSWIKDYNAKNGGRNKLRRKHRR